jgi:hypothetical protein
MALYFIGDNLGLINVGGAMSFVTEIISTEDQKLIGFEQIKDPIGRPLRPYKWTVDRDRKMFLLQTYRGGEDSHHLVWFIFDIKGVRLSLQLSCKTYQEVGGSVYPWKLVQPLVLPKGVTETKQQVVEVLREALASLTNWPGPVYQVTFDF